MNMLDKILKGCLYVGLFCVPFLSFIVINSLFFPYITGKNFIFRILIEVLFAIWIILLSRKAIEGPKRTWILVSVLSFITVATLATIFSETPYRSFWSNYERMDGLVNLLHLFAYFLMLASFMRDRVWYYFLHTILGSALVAAVMGFLQMAGRIPIRQNGSGIEAGFGNSIYLGVFMLFNIFIAGYFLVRPNQHKYFRIAYSALIVAFSIILYNSGTRGVLLGLIGGAALTLILSVISLKGRARQLAAIPLIVIVIVVGIFYAMRKSEFVTGSPVLQRFANISLNDSTTRTRFIVWGMAIKGVAEHPLLGWGPENFNLVFNKYYDPRLHSQETWFDRAHNVVFDWLVATGILGLAAYLSIFVALIWTLARRSANLTVLERNVLIGLLAGYFFQNIFVFDNLTSYIVFFAIVAFIHSLTDRESEARVPSKLALAGTWTKNQLANYKSIVAPVIAVLMLFVIYFGNVKPIRANNGMLESLFRPRALLAEKLEQIKGVYDMNTFGSMEAREQLMFMLIEMRDSAQDQNLMLQYLELGAVQMQEQLKRTGNDARHQLFMGSYLHTFGKVDEAIAFFNKALELSPRKQLILFSLSRAYVDKGDYAKALEYAKAAYELDTSYARGLLEYAVVAVYAKDFELADSLLASPQGQTIASDQRLIQAYLAAVQIGRIVEIWEDKVAVEPSSVQYNFSLAASYYAAHRDSEAIAILRKIKELNPESAEQVDFYINGIQDGTLERP